MLRLQVQCHRPSVEPELELGMQFPSEAARTARPLPAPSSPRCAQVCPALSCRRVGRPEAGPCWSGRLPHANSGPQASAASAFYLPQV